MRAPSYHFGITGVDRSPLWRRPTAPVEGLRGLLNKGVYLSICMHIYVHITQSLHLHPHLFCVHHGTSTGLSPGLCIKAVTEWRLRRPKSDRGFGQSSQSGSMVATSSKKNSQERMGCGQYISGKPLEGREPHRIQYRCHDTVPISDPMSILNMALQPIKLTVAHVSMTTHDGHNVMKTEYFWSS